MTSIKGTGTEPEMRVKFNQNSSLRKKLVRGGYFLFLAALIAIFDLTIGIILIDDENSFRNYPLPPYGPIMTKAQREVLEKLKTPNPDSYIQYDQHLGWTIQPNRSTENNQYTSNSAGARSLREYTREVPVGVTRIATFGDSFTECVDVKNEEAWSYQLEQNLENVEVLNFGVRAYGTDQALLRYRKDGRQFNPQIVFIGFLLENIRRNVNRYRPAYEHNTGGLGVKPRFLKTNDGLQLLATSVSSRQHLHKLITDGKLFDSVGEHDYWYKKYKFAFNRQNILFRSNILKFSWLAYEKYQRNLKKLFREIEAEPFVLTSSLLKIFYDESLNNGAKEVLVLIFPSKKQIESYIKNESKYWQSVLDFLEKNKIQYLDFTDELAKEHVKSPVVYGHYTRKGNEIVSSLLGRWVQECCL